MSRSRKRKRKNKIIIISSVLIIVTMLTGYAAFQTNLSITAKGNIKEKSRVIQSWDENSQTDFHSDFYKQNIVSVTFLDNANVPSNATESWNVSEDKKHGGVIAYVIPSNEDNTKYDLYIGAKDGVIANPNSSFLFYFFENVKNINFGNNFDTSQTTNMSYMFNLCTSLSTIDVSNFDTSNLTNMSWMFAMYNGVTYKSSKLTKIIGIENLNTSNVTNMHSVFRYDVVLSESLDLSKWDVSNVTSMHALFDCLQSIKSLDISTWDTSNVTSMAQMFYGMYSVENLNLCSFNTSKVTRMDRMFWDTKSLKNIYVGPNWITTNVDTTEMFQGSNISTVTTGQCQ